MKTCTNLACCMALLSLAAPAHADVHTAAFTGASDRAPTQTSMFVGATFRIGLNGKPNEPRYRAGLGFSGMTRNPNTSELRVGQGLELSLAGNRKPTIRLTGSDVGVLWQTAKLNDGGKTALIVVGVVAAVGVATLLVLGGIDCAQADDPCES